MKTTRVLVVALLGFTAACSTPPGKVPELHPEKLPHVSSMSSKVRDLKLDVKNTRKVNEDAGNVAQVEDVVRKAILQALARDGVAVREDSANSLNVTISDYDGNGGRGECVKLNGTLRKGTRQRVNAESFGCHTMEHWVGDKPGGNVSEAYQESIKTLLNVVDKRVAELGD